MDPAFCGVFQFIESKMNHITEIQLHYQYQDKDMKKVSSSKKAYEVFLSQWDQNTIELVEEFKIMLLNRANKLLGIYNHSKGGVSGTVVDVKLILAAVIKSNASGIIIAHNHPSGNLKPSQNDIRLTEKIKKACELMDIQLIDHIIISNMDYYSFCDEGMI